jgi:hypothetical protein
MKPKTLLLLTSVLSLTWSPIAQANTSKAAASKDPSVAAADRGQLRVFTPDRKRWHQYWEDYVWENPNYCVYREDGSKVRSGFHRRPLTLDAGVYQVRIVGCSAPPTRVVIEPRRITEITMAD